jgi:hypothetical protein
MSDDPLKDYVAAHLACLQAAADVEAMVGAVQRAAELLKDWRKEAASIRYNGFRALPFPTKAELLEAIARWAEADQAMHAAWKKVPSEEQKVLKEPPAWSS